MRVLALLVLILATGPAAAQRWATTWVAPSQAFASPGVTGLGRDQTARLIVRPSVWGTRARLRFSNAFGTVPLVIDGVYAGLQAGGAALVPGTNRPVTFGGKKSLTIAAGGLAWSDSMTLPPAGPALAISLHWAGDVAGGHMQSFQTSYLTPPGAGALGELEDDGAFSQPTAAVPVLDAMDIQAAADMPVVLCLGDSLTAGTTAIPNAHDRWPDVMERRLRATGWTGTVLNAGSAPDRNPGARLERDVLGLSGVTHIVWLHGADELAGSAATDTVRDGMNAILRRIREKSPRAKVILGLLPGTGIPGRAPLNSLIHALPADGFVAFDRAESADPASFAGQLAMGQAVDLRLLTAGSVPTPERRVPLRPVVPRPVPAGEPPSVPF